jgi:hypothetical protein
MANKKINQLVAKTTIQSTDLFPLGDASTGQLFKKTIAELQAAIGGAVISVNGLVGTVVLDTDDIQELATPTNKYFTDARARGAISLTVTGNSGASTYNSSTGVLNVPTYTLAGLGGITASFLSGASGIAYNSSTGVITYTGTVYTDASIRALFSAGTGISYNSSTGAISYSGTVYTDASIRALISLTTTGNSGVSSYNNTTGVLNVPNYTLAGLGGIGASFLSAGTGISYSSSTGVISYSGTVYTDSSVRGLFSATAPITYNSSTGAIGITQASTSANGFLSSTDWNTFNGKQNALTLGNVTEVASNVLLFPDGGTNKTIGNLSIQVVQAGASTNGYLSSTDWTTFNNKQGAITFTTTGTTGASTFSSGALNIPQYQGQITLTTTGTSGAATFSSNTLNIPQYQAVLTNPVTGTGTTNYVTKWTSSSAIGNSQIFDNGTAVGIGTNSTGFNTAGLPLIVGSGTGNTGMTIFSGSTSSGSIHFADAVTTGNASFSGFINYDHSGNSMQFGTTNTERMRISSSGWVGIGTNAPNQLLTLSAAAYPILGFNIGSTSHGYVGSLNAGGIILNSQQALPIFFYTTDTERMRITSGGVVGISNTSPDTAYDAGNWFSAKGLTIGNTSTTAGLQIVSSPTSTLSSIRFGSGTDGLYDQGFVGYLHSTNRLVLGANRNTTLVITSANNILMGTTTDNGERLYVSGSIRATGSITANSDVRLKKNIERIENALQKVSEISGYTYNTIYDEDRHAGVIAQEIDKVLPEIVNKGNDGLMGVEYGNISALLIEAIKEQKVLIESLQAKVEALSK